MKLNFEYGNGLMSAELPDNTDVFIPGETVQDPPCLSQDWDSLYRATLKSIREPIGMEPLAALAKGKKKRCLCNPGYCERRESAHQPPQGRHPGLP